MTNDSIRVWISNHQHPMDILYTYSINFTDKVSVIFGVLMLSLLQQIFNQLLYPQMLLQFIFYHFLQQEIRGIWCFCMLFQRTPLIYSIFSALSTVFLAQNAHVFMHYKDNEQQ